MVVVNESGLYSLILSSKLPNAKGFKRWVTSEVLPSIRKTGSYSINSDKGEYKRRSLEVRELNARTRQAQLLARMAEKTLNKTYKDCLIANAANMIMGKQILPLPALNGRTYKAEEVGELLGVTANRIGRIANINGLKTEQYGGWFADKAKGADKEVQTFRYNEDGVAKLRELLSE